MYGETLLITDLAKSSPPRTTHNNNYHRRNENQCGPPPLQFILRKQSGLHTSLQMQDNSLCSLGDLPRRLQSRIRELDLLCEQIAAEKKKLAFKLKSPLVSVLSTDKRLKASYESFCNQQQLRSAEKELLVLCVNTVRNAVRQQQSQREKIKQLQDQVRRLKEQRVMTRDISSARLSYSKSDLSPLLYGEVEEPPNYHDRESCVDTEDIPGTRKIPRPYQTKKEVIPQKILKPIDRLASAAIMHSEPIFMRSDPTIPIDMKPDPRLYSMAKAVYDPLRRTYTWAPVGIVNDVDVLKLLLQGGHTPNKILGKKPYSKKWKDS
jgi:hypothetical protein